MRRLLAPLILILCGGTSAAAPKPPPGAVLRFMKGECDRLVFPGRPRAGCRPQLINLVYATGGVSFVFAGTDGRLVSFRNRIDRQTGDQTRLAVDQVTIVSRGGQRYDVRPARGSCLLTPFAMGRSRLECTARAGPHRFSALFRTSDDAPKLLALAGD